METIVLVIAWGCVLVGIGFVGYKTFIKPKKDAERALRGPIEGSRAKQWKEEAQKSEQKS